MAVEAAKFRYEGQSFVAPVAGCRLDREVKKMRKTDTKTGWTTTVHVIKKFSQTRRKATNAFGENLHSSQIQSCRDGQHGHRRGWHWRVEMK